MQNQQSNELLQEFLLHIGDISYARGVGALWDAFMTQIQPIAARVPYMTGIGNHEYDHETGGECAVPMVHRFHSPTNGNGLFWYSFDVGPVHILFFSTEHDYLPKSTQYEWIENDLRSVNRSSTNVRIERRYCSGTSSTIFRSNVL